MWALHVLVVGLALHNFVMAELWQAGVRGNALDVVSAWKDVLLLVALVLAIRARRRLPFDGVAADWLAVAFGGFVVLYALIPQSWLDGGASTHGVLLGLRHDGLPVAAYFLGRALDLTRRELAQVFRTILVTAAAVAAFGLVDIYAIPLQWWRDSGAPGWFRDQLGFTYQGLSGLPENFVYNTGTSSRCGASSRRSSRRSRPRTCSWSRCSSRRRGCCATGCAAGCSRSGSRSPRCSSPGCSGRTRARRTSRSRSGSWSSRSRCRPALRRSGSRSSERRSR